MAISSRMDKCGVFIQGTHDNNEMTNNSCTQQHKFHQQMDQKNPHTKATQYMISFIQGDQPLVYLGLAQF